MEQLLRRRTRLQGKLNRIVAFIEEKEGLEINMADLQIRIDMLAEIWTDFDTTQTQIECTCSETDLDTQQAVQDEFESRFCNAKAKLLRKMEHESSSVTTTSANENGVSNRQLPINHAINVKLPSIELPTFSGDFRQWASFKDLFNSVINNNTLLSNVQKLHYLKSAVRGEAATLLKSIAITEANYQEAWKILSDRFSNKKQIIYSHLKSMYAQTKLTHESAKDIRKLLDTTVENIRALFVLGLPTDHWDQLLVFLITERLDSTTRRQWELFTADNENPAFEEIKQFLEKRCRALEATVPDKATPRLTSNQPSYKHPSTIAYHSSIPRCIQCKEPHPIYKCEQFIKLSTTDKFNLVKASDLCINCLRSGHTVKRCKSSTCRKCQKPHNTLLHRDLTNQIEPVPQDSSLASLYSTKHQPTMQVLLATAVLEAVDNSGNRQQIRALLDSGSQATFISESCVQRIGIQRHKSSMTVTGLGNSGIATCKGVVELNLSSKHTSTTYHVRAYILPHVTSSMPVLQIDSTLLRDTIRTHHLQLADPDYHKPGSIDLLLGADIYYEILLAGKIRAPNTNLTLLNTSIGWIIAGTIGKPNSATTVFANLALDNLNAQLQQFWELEEIPKKKFLTNEEISCEELFKKTHCRTTTGRFIIDLPFNDQKEKVGNSKDIVTQRLLQIEKRLDRNPGHKEEYIKFMKEYLELNHMELVNKDSTNTGNYYLPHHYVIRNQSTSTRLRVVFDGSAQPTNGISLNQALMIGPSLQEDLIHIVTRFRLHNIVYTADISKMYRQILVNPEHCDYQRIVWRDQPNKPIQEYRLNTVTYGTSSAPFLAIRCLHELASIGKEHYPLASSILLTDFYVDDVMSGNDTITEALLSQDQLINLLKSAGIQLHKWASNTTKLLACTPRTSHGSVNLSLESNVIKTLGIDWDSYSDHFTFHVLPYDNAQGTTKRAILSYISKLFDPLGWISPILVKAKIMIQHLWLVSIGWDDQLPPDICKEWELYQRELPSISDITIPRQMILNSLVKSYWIHGFSDASEMAYGAVVYIRSTYGISVSVQLVCSKSRVAPLKKISIPRLELCGALLLARLMQFVVTALSTTVHHMTAWTDSTIVLSWIDKHPHSWKSFVANRVTEIQQLIPPEHWRHTRSEDNPADCLSRGVSPSQLKHHQLWWHGPAWLQLPESDWPARSYSVETATLESKLPSNSRAFICVATWKDKLNIVEKYSSLTKIIRITAYCFRFTRNCRLSKTTKQLGLLTTQELHNGLIYWIRVTQIDQFSEEIAHCNQNLNLPRRSQLLSLNPFIDDLGILRVGGRIQEAHIPYSQKHPIILPCKHVITDLIINYFHLKYLHAGPQLLLTIIRTKYWILKAKQRIRKLIHHCTKCFRLRVQTSQQLMGNLPQHRLEPVRPFMRCGVDYAGPIAIKSHKGKGKVRVTKSYICIFVCFSTRALHIELASDLTTEAFIAALRRFTARRGKPSDIHSDCGTNFVGARRQLQDLHKLIASSLHNQQVSRALSEDSINWHFSPPLTPHYGGLWEAGVKSVKFHLRRTIGLTILTYEELYTMLAQVEACLNSRPLCSISTDPDDFNILTPGHFLIGQSLIALPDHDLTHIQINRLNRWQAIQRMFQTFWHKWSQEYLTRLQQRPKWVKTLPNLKVGDLVLLKERNITPLSWPMARILETHPGNDGLVRVLTLKTKNGTFKRHINNCCVLPLEGVDNLNTSV